MHFSPQLPYYEYFQFHNTNVDFEIQKMYMFLLDAAAHKRHKGGLEFMSCFQRMLVYEVAARKSLRENLSLSQELSVSSAYFFESS